MHIKMSELKAIGPCSLEFDSDAGLQKGIFLVYCGPLSCSVADFLYQPIVMPLINDRSLLETTASYSP
jgi:hypothetical protein